ncbi:MAG: GNAT family N-acetyltransferase [Deltaproteobacteria bacterium]|nr:GNAT family N-acetyltransferase [Deltaproteobacteria bacterium]
MQPATQPRPKKTAAALIRPATEADLVTADYLMRVAFSTFLGLSDPSQFMGDAGYVISRFRSDPSSAFVATVNGQVVGSNFATRWGSVGFFGPLTVRPDLWDQGIGRQLMDPIMKCLERWGVSHAGLFTFAHSPKHVGFYQTLGFWPRYLTPIMARAVTPPAANVAYQLISSARDGDLARWLAGCRAVANDVYPGLDLGSEIQAVRTLGLGDTVLLENARTIEGFAVCHIGPGTEGGSGTCFVKFGAVRPGDDAPAAFTRLLDACNAFAVARGATKVVAGVNTSRHDAYRIMLARGFASFLQGVTMHRPNEPGYSLPDRFVIDDWR